MPFRARQRGAPVMRHPALAVALGYALATLVGTVLLLLPAARVPTESPSVVTALFTATSAVCVTGLTVVDTATYWTSFGQVVLTGLGQVGGIGIMTLASLLGISVSRRLGVRSRLLAKAETAALDLGDVRSVLRGVVRISLLIEAVVALALMLRLWIGYGESVGRAAWLGVFHAVSAFNNSGFTLWSDGLARFVGDPWINVPVLVAIILGGLGFPVLLELLRDRAHPSRWTLHTRLTVVTSGALVLAGTVAVTALEWANPRTLGALTVPDRLLAGLFQGITPRSAGLSTVDYGQMHDTTWLVTDALMFVGGGSGGTAGGIKVTTFAVLLLAIVAEVRGNDSAEAFGRAVPATVLRQSVSVLVIAGTAIAATTLALMGLAEVNLDRALFETISAFATVGLTTGITPDLPAAGKLLLVALMFVGRVGTISLASALALRTSARLYRLPEERPIVG